MSSVGQHRYLHGIVFRDFLVSLDIEPSKENIETVKLMFKKYLKIASVSALSDATLSQAISAIRMLMAREFQTEVPLSEAKKTMKQILNIQ